MSIVYFVLVFVFIAIWHEYFLSSGSMVTEKRTAEAWLNRVFGMWYTIALFLVAYLFIAGDLLTSYGFPYLFRSDGDSLGSSFGFVLSPALWTSAALALLLVIGFSTSFVYQTGDEQLMYGSGALDRSAHLRYLLHQAVPLGACVLIAQLLFAGDTAVLVELLFSAAGLAGGYVIGLGLVWLAYAVPAPSWYQALITWLRRFFTYHGSAGVSWTIEGALVLLFFLQLVILLIVTAFNVIPTGAAILMLLGWLYLVISLLQLFRPSLRTVAAIAGAFVVVFTNGVEDKHKYDDFEPLYATPGGAPAATTDPIVALDAWKAHLAGIGETDTKPPLVVLALSGGAYRASFWSAVVMDELLAESADSASRLKGFAEHVKLVTGASGGTVAGAYFATNRGAAPGQPPYVLDALLDDILAARSADPDYSTVNPYGRDSLSPVIQHLVQRDLFKVFVPFFHNLNQTDRGEVLERQWAGLQGKFTDLGAGEAAGWRPSLMLNPTLASSGLPLLVSNLTMTASFPSPTLAVDNPAVHAELRTATAVRMQATFPYASPAVRLPPPTHEPVVDAGYFDNFGVHAAAHFFGSEAVRNWVVAETSGVIVILINAFASAPAAPASNRVSRAAESFVLPLSAVFQVAREGGRLRDTAAFAELQSRYAETAVGCVSCPATWFTVLELENRASSAQASMSWYVPKGGLAEIESQIHAAHNAAVLDDLADDYQARLSIP